MTTYGIAGDQQTLGTWMLEAAEIGYWAEAHINAEGTLVITGDDEGTETAWPVEITPAQMETTHRDRLFHRAGIKGVAPSNYGWLTEVDDYDAASTDWVVQYLCFGEVVY